MKRRRIGRGAFNAMLRDLRKHGFKSLAVHPTALVLGPNAETGTLDDAGEFVPGGDSGRAPTHARMRQTGTWPHAEAQPPIALVRCDALIDQWFIGPGEYMPAATSDAEIDIDAADFDEYVATLRAQEPPEGAPDSMTIEVSDGTRTETVRVRGRLAGTWTCIEGKVT